MYRECKGIPLLWSSHLTTCYIQFKLVRGCTVLDTADVRSNDDRRAISAASVHTHYCDAIFNIWRLNNSSEADNHVFDFHVLYHTVFLFKYSRVSAEKSYTNHLDKTYTFSSN